MKQEELKKLELERENHITRLFWFALEIAGIFGFPLLVAVLLSLKFGSQSRWIFLSISFILSWVVMIIRYKKVVGKMKEYDEKIKELRVKLKKER